MGTEGLLPSRPAKKGQLLTELAALLMSAIGPKQTWAIALQMSAFGGKADMTVCGNSLSRSLLGAKRTWPIAPHMSANDPKRTFTRRFSKAMTIGYGALHATIASGRVRLATVGGAKIAR